MRISPLALAAIGLLALVCAAGGYAIAHLTRVTTDVRVVVRPHEDGRIEVGLQQRSDGTWGEPLTPQRRFVSLERLERETGRWLRSSPLSIAAEPEPEPLRIGFIGSYSGTPAPSGPDRQTGAELAVAHLNAAGGIGGRPVELVIGDTGSDLEVVLAEARRLVEEEGVHAIVGPDRSSFTLAVVETVTKPAGIPTISPSATSPLLTTADDDGYLFRSITSDAAQGPALATLAREEGYTNVGVIFFDDAYGRGLAESFAAAWGQEGEELTMAAIQGEPESYLAELRMLAEHGAEVLVVISFVAQAEVFISEAIEHELFDQFLFVDATKRQYLIDVIGAEHLNGMKGTSHAPAPQSESLRLYQDAYRKSFGEPSGSDFVPTTYDAVIAIGLAAAKAGSTDGAAIRDALPLVAGPGGHEVLPGVAGIVEALAIIAAGGEVDYQGVATKLDWDAAGDVPAGQIGIWQFADGRIKELRVMPFDLREQ